MSKNKLIEIIERHLDGIDGKRYESQEFKEGFETCLHIICDIFELKD